MASTKQNATGERIAGRRCTPNEAALVDVEGVALLLACSPRHVYRMSDCGRMPRPFKLGRLMRWRRREVLGWIDGGCKAIKAAKEGAA
jgi:predicted DNA-binding transcriptional regulator AlpA